MNYELLKEVIRDNGVKMSFLADKIGISRQALHMKINGERTFTQGEIMALKTALHLSDEQFLQIFFDDDVEQISTKETV